MDNFNRPFLFVSLLFSVALSASAQIPKVAPAPLSSQMPQTGGSCSVESSCSDLAPIMIKKALGVSPLEENLRYLTDTIGGRVTGSPSADRAVGWAVEAFRHAGVDEVHTEKYTCLLYTSRSGKPSAANSMRR